MKFLLTLLLIIGFSSGLLAQEALLTLDDTLRGTITPERAWWDLNFYHLDVTVKPETKSIEGEVEIRYTALQLSQILQVDLQPPLSISAITQDDTNLDFTRKGNNAYFVKLSKKQQVGKTESIRVAYSGKPLEAKNPPWQGGLQWAYDKNGSAFIATSCQGLGASVWWPCKDHMYDEPDSVRISVTVPASLMDVSNGRLKNITNNGDSTRTFHWSVSNPINNYGV